MRRKLTAAVALWFAELNGMESDEFQVFGPQFSSPPGWVAELGQGGEFDHRFGGSSWTIKDMNPSLGPINIVTLDLDDPRLIELRTGSLCRLPLCSFVNCIWPSKQVFQLEPETRSVRLTSDEEVTPSENGDSLPVPIPAKPINLRRMNKEEYPISEEAYYDASEEFVGGPSFIRILGPPLWMQRVEKEVCSCGSAMKYVASIGYERIDEPRGFLDGRPFYLGELALYFFLCKACLQVLVTTQST